MVEDAPDWTKTVSAVAIVEEIPVTVEPARSFWEGKTKSYEDTNFTSAESPRTLTVRTDLGRFAHDGYITNDGDGDLQIEIYDPVQGYGGVHTLKKDETLELEMLNIEYIRLTWVADCGYRCLVV